jgi:hypothetical protein
MHFNLKHTCTKKFTLEREVKAQMGKKRNSCIVQIHTLRGEGGGSSTPRPGHSTPGKETQYTIVQEVGRKFSPAAEFEHLWGHLFWYSFIASVTIANYSYSIGMCRMWRFLAVLRNFFHSSLLYNLSCNPSPPIILPSSFLSSCHLFLGLLLGLVDSKFIYDTLLGILFSAILCTCPNQRNLCRLIISVMVGFLTIA